MTLPLIAEFGRYDRLRVPSEDLTDGSSDSRLKPVCKTVLQAGATKSEYRYVTQLHRECDGDEF